MTPSPPSSRLDQALNLFLELCHQEGIVSEPIAVKARTLSPQEAIGAPRRQDFPILVGRERMIEARIKSARGHAFTDAPCTMHGTIAEVLALPRTTNANRALIVATINAGMRYLGRIEATVHCTDDAPERCAPLIAHQLQQLHGTVHVGVIGLNPALVEGMAHHFGAGQIHVTDLDPDRIGSRVAGVAVWDGRSDTTRLITHSDLVLMSGTTLCNNTADAILDECERQSKDVVFFGVTAAGFAALLGYRRLCPCGA